MSELTELKQTLKDLLEDLEIMKNADDQLIKLSGSTTSKSLNYLWEDIRYTITQIKEINYKIQIMEEELK
ncbi:TPA: hypothetical protein U0Z15_002685 [Listeria monocytogenes]|uniref:Uncharacterized protein n=1 Tax=Listeria monocytogenes TaxID=1639 RepID=A0A7C0R054_LISMN|nr:MULTISPECIES: hypothetical protein [Listeria]ALD11158.1 hypothetical protein LM1816_18765 [Listeria monocytogenes J1-220]EAC3738665.1 hypothetical protein [Listeria monocytogenes]EAC4403333.1 hypothetical protein [Listeria monocytogenes]EAC5364794.1 hypothetical protein [Listeria monocytogenes]EAC6482895.1 hypothetical protein [Listeria monocytogenes]